MRNYVDQILIKKNVRLVMWIVFGSNNNAKRWQIGGPGKGTKRV